MLRKKSRVKEQLWMIGAIWLWSVAISSAQIPPPVVAVAETPADRIGLGAFRYGFASVKIGNEDYYIDTKGEKIRLIGSATLGDTYTVEEYERERKEMKQPRLPSQKVIFEKDGKRGVFSPKGETLLPAAYDHIETNHTQFWTLYSGNKKTYYLPDGTILPLFEDIGYLDGEYFDVKQDGGWHLYSKSKDKIVTKESYEGFDYCGGCSSGSAYVYAKKGGKWGVISWEEDVLVPFTYEHEHRSMRSDNWVASFSLNGKDVVVHIPTQQVFDASSPYTHILSGVLVTSQDGKFGAYDQHAQLVVPFEYDKLESPNANSYLGYYGAYLIARKNQKVGVIRNDGDIVLPIEYDQVFVYDDFFVAKSDGQTYLLQQGHTTPLLALENSEIMHIDNFNYGSGSKDLPAIFSVKQKAYYGLYFVESKQLLAPAFYDIVVQRNELVKGGNIIEGEKQGLKTLFDTRGEKILSFDVQEYKTFDARDVSLLAFKVKGKWGLYDLVQKKEIVPAKYDQYFKLLDSSQTVVIQAYADGFQDIDLYDLEGSQLNEVPLNRIYPIDHRYYLLEKGGRGALGYSLLDVDQKMTEDIDYRYVTTLNGTGKLLMLSHNGVDGKLYDVKQKQELDRWYNAYMFRVNNEESETSKHWLFYGFVNGYAKVQTKEGKVGFIDEQGEVVVPPKYAEADFVDKDHLLVSDGDYLNGSTVSYFIEKNGKTVFPATYFVDDMLVRNIDQFYVDGKVVLMRTGPDRELYFGWGELKTGKVLIPADYYEIAIPDVDSTYLVLTGSMATNHGSTKRSDLRYGLADINGQILFKPQFEDMHRPRFYYSYSSSGQQERTPLFPLLVLKEGKWRYLNEDGSYLPIEGDYINGY